MQITDSSRYQLLLNDIRGTQQKFNLETDEERKSEFKEELLRLIDLKSLYSNIEHFIEVVNNI